MDEPGKLRKLRRGRRLSEWAYRAAVVEPDPRAELLKDAEDLHAIVKTGDVWVGMTRAAYRKYLRARNWEVSRRTMDRRVEPEKFDRARTADNKKFYFAKQITSQIRARISEVRVGGGRPTKEDTLIVIRDRTGRSHAWLFHPRDRPAKMSDPDEFTRFRQSFPDAILDL